MGIEPPADSSTKPAIPPTGGADSGAPAADPLAAFVASLTAGQRAELVAMLSGG